MPSIIDKITDVESQATALKRESAAKAREAIANAGAEALKSVAAARDQGREELAAVQARAEEEGQGVAKSIREEKAKEADAVCAAAKEHMTEAVSYILERVKQV